MLQPLADLLRPTKLADIIGQTHLIGANKPLTRIVETGSIHSLILWGPPGSGKTTIARVIAAELTAHFAEVSAVVAGKADLKRIVETAKHNQPQPTILFIDEIHRFNKAQQDFLLPYVEDGTVILIGATTENPSFEVISALLSRSQVIVLQSHTNQELLTILDRALSSWSQALGSPAPTLSDEAKDFIINYANGDARALLNLLENSVKLYGNNTAKTITLENLKDTLQSKHLRYDTKGEEHYNTISAFIKSMRASDPDAALYYLARMVEAGEDPKFIARRMVIFASEDIGMGQPTALVVANEVFRAVEIIGYPECAINLAHGVVYLATAKKDRRAYDGLRAAQADVAAYGNLDIPLHLRNAPTKLMKDIGYGRDYEPYPEKKNLLPSRLKGKKYYK